jgi:hypothetical protein
MLSRDCCCGGLPVAPPCSSAGGGMAGVAGAALPAAFSLPTVSPPECAKRQPLGCAGDPDRLPMGEGGWLRASCSQRGRRTDRAGKHGAPCALAAARQQVATRRWREAWNAAGRRRRHALWGVSAQRRIIDSCERVSWPPAWGRLPRAAHDGMAWHGMGRHGRAPCRHDGMAWPHDAMPATQYTLLAPGGLFHAVCRNFSPAHSLTQIDQPAARQIPNSIRCVCDRLYYGIKT